MKLLLTEGARSPSAWDLGSAEYTAKKPFEVVIESDWAMIQASRTLQFGNRDGSPCSAELTHEQRGGLRAWDLEPGLVIKDGFVQASGLVFATIIATPDPVELLTVSLIDGGFTEVFTRLQSLMTMPDFVVEMGRDGKTTSLSIKGSAVDYRERRWPDIHIDATPLNQEPNSRTCATPTLSAALNAGFVPIGF